MPVGSNGGVFNGGGGNDTFSFVGGAAQAFGNVVLTEPPSSTGTTNLDFSNFTDGGVNLNLNVVSAQQVSQGLNLTLPVDTTISSVIGSAAADTIIAASPSTVLQGSAPDDVDQSALPAVPPTDPQTQWVYLDFTDHPTPTTVLFGTNPETGGPVALLHDGTGELDPNGVPYANGATPPPTSKPSWRA